MVRSPRNAASATLALNWSDNFRRFVVSVFLHKAGIHLNRLSDCAGPLHQPGEVVIADNLSSHKSAVAQAFLKAQGNWLVFLPPYSPDLNPNEMAFSKFKAHLPRMKARTFDTLFETVAEACELFPQQECQNYFRAAG